MIGEHVRDTVDTDSSVAHIQRTYFFHQHSRYGLPCHLYLSYNIIYIIIIDHHLVIFSGVLTT
jgi:hypothetical protein